MATAPQIDAVVNSAVSAFNGDAALFQTFLERAKLGTELEQLKAAERTLRADYATATTAFNDPLTANQDAQASKTAEIDSLGA